MEERKIGDMVWWATCEVKPIEIECLVCFGKCKVTVILGNGEQVETGCEYCSIGFERPRGFTSEHQRISGVKEISITGKEVREDEKGKHVEYRYENYCLYNNENIFNTKEEAENRVLEMIKEYENSEVERLAHKKKSNQSHYSWSIGYYRKKIKDAQRDLDYYSGRIKTL
jgi:hypothetical protein